MQMSQETLRGHSLSHCKGDWTYVAGQCRSHQLQGIHTTTSPCSLIKGITNQSWQFSWCFLRFFPNTELQATMSNWLELACEMKHCPSAHMRYTCYKTWSVQELLELLKTADSQAPPSLSSKKKNVFKFWTEESEYENYLQLTQMCWV